jgi:methylenetetrahydrofolate dehydrogenase (NADP+) / methenyltetrahydrofolate cyclohydrolase
MELLLIWILRQAKHCELRELREPIMDKRLAAKPVIRKIYDQIKTKLENVEGTPCLNILIIGNDPAAEFYVNNLIKKGNKVGIQVEVLSFEKGISQTEFSAIIHDLNNDDNVNGIMIQKPLPAEFNEDTIIKLIDPSKDVDGFHPINMGNLVLDKDGFIPSTAEAVLEILNFYQIETSGKKVTIIGRSNIVGKPLANLLLRKNSTGNATVTVTHSRSKDLRSITSEADILIAAIGQAQFVTSDMIKNGSIIIDVGINQIKDPEKEYRYVGDVDYDDCFDKCKAITPVPGGVGSVTTSLLLNNVLKSFLKNKK